MIACWVQALPQAQVREHANLLLTTALYLLNTGAQTNREQRERCYHEARQLMARVETALQGEIDEVGKRVSATPAGAGDIPRAVDESRAAEYALLQWRLRLLHMQMVVREASASGAYERLNAMQQEIEEANARDEEAIWQMVPLLGSFLLSYTARQEGARLVPRLLEAKERVSRKASRYASIKARQWLAQAAVEAGQLHLAYEECQIALDLIEQIKGYALLRGYPQIVLAQVLYQWNRLEEARSQLRMVVHNAAEWQQLDLLGWGYSGLMQVALATGDRSLAELALHELFHLVQREHYGDYPNWLPGLRADFWLAQRQLGAASDWAAGVVFPDGVWERGSYDAFPAVMRVYFAQRSFREAAELLERWSGHLDRPANVRITITYLAQSLVALHHVGKSEQARVVAERLLALTEPEGYVRVYLDEGEPMREALLAVLTSRSQQHEFAASTRASISKLLAAFEHEAQGASASLEVTPTSRSIPSPARQASALSSSPGVSLTRREQEVLRLLATGASNQDIAHILVIELPTVKKHVSNLLGKLGATSRTQAISQARARSLL